MLHADPAPHSIVHEVLPAHSAVQPPPGHLMAHLLLPVHAIVDPAPSDALQSLPPPHVTVLFVPVSRLHVLVPVHVEVQFDPQLPVHVDWPAQAAVHPVPQVRSHVFFVSQLNVALFGAPASPASAPPPKLHVPPALHSHVLPVQTQSPVHVGFAAGTSSSSPQPGWLAEIMVMTAMPTPAEIHEALSVVRRILMTDQCQKPDLSRQSFRVPSVFGAVCTHLSGGRGDDQRCGRVGSRCAFM
jgi:hypothetical protein